MTDQTPSTEDVRAEFCQPRWTPTGGHVSSSDLEARFDAWLAAHNQAIRADELRKALAELRAAKEYLAGQGLELTADAIIEGIENRLADLEGDDHA